MIFCNHSESCYSSYITTHLGCNSVLQACTSDPSCTSYIQLLIEIYSLHKDAASLQVVELRRYFGAAKSIILLKVQREMHSTRSLEQLRGHAPPEKEIAKEEMLLFSTTGYVAEQLQAMKAIETVCPGQCAQL